MSARRPPTAPSVMGNAGVLLAGRVVVAALGWAGSLLIIRELSKEDWGRYSFVFNLLSLMVILTDIVNARQALRGYYDADEPGTFAGIYVLLRATLGLIAYPLAIAIVVIGGYSDQVVRAAALAGLSILLSSPSVAYDSVYQAHLKVRVIALASVLGQLVQFLLTIVLIVGGSSMVILVVPAVVCEVVALSWKLWCLRSLIRIRYRIVIAAWGQLLKLGVPFAIGGALKTVYYSIDGVMLSRMDSFRAVGEYGIAYKFAGVAQFLPYAVSASVIAVMVRHWPDRASAFWATFNKAFVVLSFIAILVTAGFVLFSEPAIRMLYGDHYAVAADATRIVLVSECIGFFVSLSVTTLVALGRNVLYPIAALIGLAVNVAANLVVIPRWSYNGAAWATLITELIVVTMLWLPIMRVAGRTPLPLSALGKALAAGVLAVAVAVAVDLVLPWLLAAFALAAVYVVVLHVARIPGPDGLRSLLLDDPDVQAAEAT